MHLQLLASLTAPGGGRALTLASVAARQGEEILCGAVRAEGRGLYPIQDGILNLLPRGAHALSPAQGSNLLPPTARLYEPLWRTRSLSLLSGQPLAYAQERQRLFDLLGEPQGTRWLDLAASTALYGRWLAPRLAGQGGWVIALDLSLPMLQEARRRARAAALHNLAFVVGRGEKLPFATGTLDGVLCGGSLNEFGVQAPHVLAELGRALRPGAVGLFMYLLTARSPWGRGLQHGAEAGGIRFWTLSEATALFEQAGLKVEANWTRGVVAFSRVRRD